MTSENSRNVPALDFNGTIIRDHAEMLCMTDMWKAAGSDASRQPSNWLASADAERFIGFLSEILIPGNSGNELVKTVRGGRNPGTWAHWQVGFAYAKYLSPEFHKWCNDVVRERMEGRGGPHDGFVTGFDDPAKTTMGGVVKTVFIKQVAEMLPALAGEAIRELLPALIKAEIVSQTRIYRDGRTAGEIWRNCGFPPIRLGGWFGNRLKAIGCQIDGNGRGELGLSTARMFDPDRARHWLKNGGELLVRQKIAERQGQGVLKLVPKKPEEK
jgi:hypothetical protein